MTQRAINSLRRAEHIYWRFMMKNCHRFTGIARQASASHELHIATARKKSIWIMTHESECSSAHASELFSEKYLCLLCSWNQTPLRCFWLKLIFKRVSSSKVQQTHVHRNAWQVLMETEWFRDVTHSAVFSKQKSEWFYCWCSFTSVPLKKLAELAKHPLE